MDIWKKEIDKMDSGYGEVKLRLKYKPGKRRKRKAGATKSGKKKKTRAKRWGIA